MEHFSTFLCLFNTKLWSIVPYSLVNHHTHFQTITTRWRSLKWRSLYLHICKGNLNETWYDDSPWPPEAPVKRNKKFATRWRSNVSIHHCTKTVIVMNMKFTGHVKTAARSSHTKNRVCRGCSAPYRTFKKQPPHPVSRIFMKLGSHM